MAEVKVRYKGMSDIRTLPADQLKERGVEGIDHDLVFHAGNLWSVKVPMSDELEAILIAEGTFTIVKVKDDGSTDEDDAVATAVPQDDTGSTVVMPDGQVDKADANVPLSSETGGTTTPDTNVATGR